MDTQLDELGARVVPALEHLLDATPSIRSAMVCTEDGLNLAAMGLEQSNVGRIAALTSSLRAVASAHVTATSPMVSGPPHVSVAVDDVNCVALSVPDVETPRLLLVAVADGLGLGMLLVEARKAAQEIAEYAIGGA